MEHIIPVVLSVLLSMGVMVEHNHNNNDKDEDADDGNDDGYCINRNAPMQ